MKRFFCFILLTFTLIFACTSEKNKLPNTPETVVRQWQYYIDRNLLDSARMLSAGSALDYIDYLAELGDIEPLEEENNMMIDLNCATSSDSAVCNYYFEDELGLKMPGRLVLAKTKDQWQVFRIDDVETEFFDSLNVNEMDMIFPDSLAE